MPTNSLTYDTPELEYRGLEDFLGMRFGMLTKRDHAGLVKMDEKIKASAFFSAKVGKAHVLERLHRVSDTFSHGIGNLATARAELTDYLKQSGYTPGNLGPAPPGVDPKEWVKHQKISNLASTSRLNLILEQNRRMAAGAGEYQRMNDPDIKEFYPCVIYHALTDGRGRHAQYNGMVVDKDDPWLKSHFPPWEFNCRCWLEDTVRPANPKEVRKFNPDDEIKVESESGYQFRPDLAFEANDLSQLPRIKDRQRVLAEMTDLVRSGKLSNCTFLAASPLKRMPSVHKLAGLKSLTSSMDKIQLDALEKSFSQKGIAVGTLPESLQQGLGLQDAVEVKLSLGNNDYGIMHNLQHHPETIKTAGVSSKVLSETLGNPNARCVLGLGRQDKQVRKTVVVQNPKTAAYCVLQLADDGKTAEIVSWHRQKRR